MSADNPSDLSLDAELDAFLNRTDVWACSAGTDSLELDVSATGPSVEFDPIDRKSTVQASVRRAYLARYVKGVVGACALLCMLAAARVGKASSETTLPAIAVGNALGASLAR